MHLPYTYVYPAESSQTCQGDQSDKLTTCPRGPIQPGPGDVIYSQMDKETTYKGGPHLEGLMCGCLSRFHFK